MKNESLYKKTVDILFKAYFNDTLEHSECAACAVGNIILANHGLAPVRNEYGLEWPHDKLDYSQGVSWYSVVEMGQKPNEYVNKLIEPTGYSWDELRKIEHAFESAPGAKSRWDRKDEDWMFNGLVAVLDVLKEIHEVEEEIAETSIQPFKTHYTSKI